jgi:hypothetical protein
MRKIRLNLERLTVESFAMARDDGEGKGTVRGHLSAYYERCQGDDTWQQSCTCEPTCNAETCFNCGGGSAGCGGGTYTGNCCRLNVTVDPTSCEPDCPG